MSTIVLSILGGWVLSSLLALTLITLLERRRSAKQSQPTYPVQGFRLALRLTPFGPAAVPIYFYRWRRLRGLAALAMGLQFLLLAAFAVVLSMPLRHARAKALDARVDAQANLLRNTRWDRPVLRGEPIDGNADDMMRAALDLLVALPDVEKLDEKARGHLVHKNREVLAQLRASTQYSWVARHRDGRVGFDDASALPGDELVKAVNLLERMADGGEPGDCLRICADAVRLAQDLQATGDLLDVERGANIIVRMSEFSIGWCSTKASLEERESAAREMRALAASQAPVADGFAMDKLFVASAADIGGLDPASSPRSVSGWLGWDEQAEAVNMFLEDSTSWRQVGDIATPEGGARAMKQELAHADSKNPMVAATRREPRYVYTYIDSQVFLRLSALVLEGRVIQQKTGTLPVEPPDAINAKELADPYTGKPLHWQYRKDEVHVWSSGIDGRDDGGEKQSDDRWLAILLHDPPPAPTNPKGAP